jgi:hypothetical protein
MLGPGDCKGRQSPGPLSHTTGRGTTVPRPQHSTHTTGPTGQRKGTQCPRYSVSGQVSACCAASSSPLSGWISHGIPSHRASWSGRLSSSHSSPCPGWARSPDSRSPCTGRTGTGPGREPTAGHAPMTGPAGAGHARNTRPAYSPTDRDGYGPGATAPGLRPCTGQDRAGRVGQGIHRLIHRLWTTTYPHVSPHLWKTRVIHKSTGVVHRLIHNPQIMGDIHKVFHNVTPRIVHNLWKTLCTTCGKPQEICGKLFCPQGYPQPCGKLCRVLGDALSKLRPHPQQC